MEKLFTIQPDDHHGIYTGIKSNDLQFFIAVSGVPEAWKEPKFRLGYVVIILFTPEGDKHQVIEHRYLPPEPVSLYERWKCSRQMLWQAFEDMRVFEFMPIEVKKFFLPGHYIGITQYTASHQKLLSEPEWKPEEANSFLPACLAKAFNRSLENYSDEEIANDKSSLEQWKERGNFVLYCSNDFWCFSNGEIHSS